MDAYWCQPSWVQDCCDYPPHSPGPVRLMTQAFCPLSTITSHGIIKSFRHWKVVIGSLKAFSSSSQTCQIPLASPQGTPAPFPSWAPLGWLTFLHLVLALETRHTAIDLMLRVFGSIQIRLILVICIKNIPISAEFLFEQHAQWCPVGR